MMQQTTRNNRITTIGYVHLPQSLSFMANLEGPVLQPAVLLLKQLDTFILSFWRGQLWNTISIKKESIHQPDREQQEIVAENQLDSTQ